MPEALFTIDELCVRITPGRAAAREGAGAPIVPVRGVSLSVSRGEVLGVVGESGSGKTLTFMAALGLLPPGASVEGSVRFEGRDLLGSSGGRLAEIRGARIGMVFQDAMSALTPHLKVGMQLAEMQVTHAGRSWRDARREALQMLERVGVPEPGRRMRQYPHELSGGLRQRVMIGMSLMCSPALLIADEPTTALDVTLQAQIIALLAALRASGGMSLVLVSHDLAVVGQLADRVAVMYAGRVVETGPASRVMRRPRHPYTAALIACTPTIDAPVGQRMATLPGQPPSVAAMPPGCDFAPRCPRARERCRAERPCLSGSGTQPAVSVACHFPLSP